LPARGGKTFKADRTIHRSPLSGNVVTPGRTRQSREDFSPESSLAEGQRSLERVGSKIFIRRGSDTQKLVDDRERSRTVYRERSRTASAWS
jgi:hypothetical protein